MRATIGITAGDPAGIGLEVILKAIPSVLPQARWVLFADSDLFLRNVAAFHPAVRYRCIENLAEISDDPLVYVRDLGGDTSTLTWGDLSPRAGQRALAYLDAASSEALRGNLDAIVTAPVSKEAIGGNFHGQTDFLAERAGVEQYAMAFFAPTFKVVLATIHMSLREALERISTNHYVRLIQFVHKEIKPQRIAVAGINPHAGEGGMFGREELDILTPAVQHAAASGIPVSGPYSPDSVYYRAQMGEFDLVIAPYHDQGLIPVKLVAHGAATNVTLGLPYVRTSPDHGTAFAIAGKGQAEASAMQAAMRCAIDLIQKRKANR